MKSKKSILIATNQKTRVDAFDIFNIKNNISNNHVNIVTDFECNKTINFFSKYLT